MGRKSREKKERRERGDGPLAALIATYSNPDLLATLDAATTSPSAAQRALTLSMVFHAAVGRRRAGPNAFAPTDLHALVADVAEILPELWSMEDFQPYDARLEVLVPWNGGLFRMLPGSMERPTQAVRQQRLLASVIDPVLIRELGFGLADAGELVLRRMDAVANALAAVWPTGPQAEIGEAATVTDAEVAAIISVPSMDDLVSKCSNPEAAALALDRYTVRGDALASDGLSMVATSTFGTTIAVALRGGDRVALPAGLLAEIIPELGVDLASTAMKLDPRVERRWHHEIGNHIGHRFQGTSHKIAGPARLPNGEFIHSLVFFDDRRVLALGNCAALTTDKKAELISRGARALEAVVPGSSVDTPLGSLSIRPDAEVLRLQLTAGPMFAGIEGRELPTIGTDDLEWILHTERADHDDLWYFIRDLTDTPGIEHQMAWDLIDQWQVWHDRKSFYRGAASVSFMTFAAHEAIAEWNAAAEAAAAEAALHRLGLRSVWDWPAFDLQGSRGFEVADNATDEVIKVLTWEIPIALDRVEAAAPREHTETLWRLSIGLDWKLTHSKEAFLSAATQSDLASVRIRFKFVDRDDGPGFTVEDAHDQGNLTIGWDSRAQLLLAEDSFAVEELLGYVVSHLVAPDHRSNVTAAWNAAPPGIRVDGFNVRQLARGLPEPITTHESLRADIERALGHHLQEVGCTPGTFAGAAATTLESGTVFPWLLQQLHETFAPYSADSLLNFSMVQLERAGYQRFIVDKRIGWNRGFPLNGDAADDDDREAYVRATRVISLILEEALATPPAGDRELDDTAWADIYAVGELCVDSCFRSDAVHWRLRDVIVSVSDLYEIDPRTTDQPTDFDMVAYTAARAAATRPAAVPIATGQHLDPDPDPDDDEPQPLATRMPQLVGIDAAMQTTLGFGIDALTGLINVATQWDATEEHPVTLASVDDIVDLCVELGVGATAEQYRAALVWTTLRSADLQDKPIRHWDSDRRAHRITVCPFVDAGEGQVWVLPWTLESMTRVLANYLSDGRLPWPSTALPSEVVTALNTYRQARNHELEQDIGSALADRGFVTRNSVKPEKKDRYGLATLSGEIDTICIDPTRSRIWVIEAKDPTIPFSSRNIRRMVDDFHQPGRYIDKLLQKVADVSGSASSLATALGVADPERAWDVIPLAVTRYVDPASFALVRRVPFCVIDDVAEVVDRDAPPAEI